MLTSLINKGANMLKLLIPILIILSSHKVLAAPSYEGRYHAAKHIYMVGYMSEAECQSDGGEWLEEHCFFATYDELTIDADKIVIETIGHNAHTCVFEESFTQQDAQTLISKVEVTDYSDEILNCEVRVTTNDEWMSAKVSATGEGCHFFCGMRSVLDIESAIKQ